MDENMHLRKTNGKIARTHAIPARVLSNTIEVLRGC